jgi:hypothetical protein
MKIASFKRNMILTGHNGIGLRSFCRLHKDAGEKTLSDEVRTSSQRKVAWSKFEFKDEPSYDNEGKRPWSPSFFSLRTWSREAEVLGKVKL